MGKRSKPRNNVRRVQPTKPKPGQMSMRTRRLIFFAMAVVVILTMVLALAPDISRLT